MDGISSLSGAGQDTNNVVTSSVSKTLGKDDFMKLFLTSLQYQDPSSPLDTNEMMSQMAQLSLMEQVANMTTAVDKLSEQAQNSALQSAVNFIGKDIKGVSLNGEVIGGKVESVQQTTNGVMLKLKDNDSLVPMTYVTEIN
ncbi:flagellar hook capping FlgD N-terminal domain-containing protein [Listeria monocytogenes]|uniref:flagellar hook assembly protein FlgD n=1 Tax=Listeria monocytogenes TaxID=1639 RepID=UPI00074D6A0E|nr:flagellar hook capping FlgD N-terminal domain-containing protein [Listeria monocytogenes]CUL71954.1 Flagellar hook assembly protein FlgD [Listeria monocytogenes]